MILTINRGSSSVKFALFSPGKSPQRRLHGNVDPGKGIEAILSHAAPDEIMAVGHRIVHGGGRFVQPTRIDDSVIAGLRELFFLDPTHLPDEVATIEEVGKHLPDVPQFACFDTAFFHDLPRVAQIVPVPRKFEEAGIRRYGFHGLSYQYLLGQLRQMKAAEGRIILAHLGNGASMAAVRDGKCIDTSMCFTPAAGIMMGTRPGDLDPGVILQIMRSSGKSLEEMDHLLNFECGLLGVSEISSDVRQLLAHRASDPRAGEAIDLFCHIARKWIGSFAAELGGLQTLVFAGGIGENSAEIRAGICSQLEFLGVRLDAAANGRNAAVISAADGPCAVRVIKTDEESVIARAVCEVGGFS